MRSLPWRTWFYHYKKLDEITATRFQRDFGIPEVVIHSWYRIFMKETGSGFLDRGMFETVLLVKHAPSKTWVNIIFKLFDRDRDDRLSFADFLGIIQINYLSNRKRIELVAQMLVFGHEDSITPHEVATLLWENRRITRERITEEKALENRMQLNEGRDALRAITGDYNLTEGTSMTKQQFIDSFVKLCDSPHDGQHAVNVHVDPLGSGTRGNSGPGTFLPLPRIT